MHPLDLPTELLQLIVEQIDHEQDLNALAQTCRFLYTLANPHLYQTNAQSDNKALSWAALHGKVPTAKLCLQYGADFNVSSLGSDKGHTPLLTAAKEDHAMIVDLFLQQEQPAEVIQRPVPSVDHTWSLLSWAAEEGSLNVVAYLLDRDDVDPDGKDPGGATPLWRAANAAQPGTLKLLLGTGKVDVNARMEGHEGHGWSPLKAAEWLLRWIHDSGADGLEEVEEIMMTLLRHPDIEYSVGLTDQMTDIGGLLWHIARNGPVAMMELLLDKSELHVDEFRSAGQTLLSWSVSTIYPEIVDILLSRGADPNSRDNGGQTPLSHAADGWGMSVIPRLIAAGADVNAQDKSGATPLWYALSGEAKENREEIVKILLAAGAAVPSAKMMNRLNISRLLCDAAEHGQTTIMEILLDTIDVDPGLQDSYAQIPLIIATEHKREAVVRLLLGSLRRGMEMDVNARDKDGRSPLHHAILQHSVTITEMLLDDARVDVNVKDKMGASPLYTAVSELIQDWKSRSETQQVSEQRITARETIVTLLLALPDTSVELKPGCQGFLQELFQVAGEQGCYPIVELLLQRWRDHIRTTGGS